MNHATGPDQGRCNRCKWMGQKKIPMHSSVRFLPQIMRKPVLRKHKAYNAQNTTKLLFPRNETKHVPKYTSERFILPKTCPSTITLTFPPLIYTAMFQNLLFNHIKNEFHIHFPKYCGVHLRFCI